MSNMQEGIFEVQNDAVCSMLGCKNLHQLSNCQVLSCRLVTWIVATCEALPMSVFAAE